uniref:Transposase (Putative), gypsy type n=1 Tax=Tanacetum cinerariifolium TaxID=118510 RepID=A0A6L2L1B0_TANCI|nr:hypothetical protein [Tanacetum cinerariifolium]
MGRDTIQLENAVSTISQEYVLEFTSEYGIPKSLHLELPGPKDPIVEFLEGKVGVYTKFFEFANFCIHILQFLFDILGHYQIHLSQLLVIGAAKVPLLTATANRVIDMEDMTGASGSSRTPSTVEKLPLDFLNEDPPSLITESIGAEEQGQYELSQGAAPVGSPLYMGVAPEPDLEKETVNTGALVSKRCCNRGPDEAVANAPPKIIYELRKIWTLRNQPPLPPWLDPQEVLLEAEVDIKGATEAKNVELAKELESLSVQFSDLQVSNNQLSQQVLDALSIDFDEELYPHMLTAFADVVYAGIAKGMSEGLKHGVKHGKAKVDLAAIEAYDPEADTKYVTALHVLKDLKYHDGMRLEEADEYIISSSLGFGATSIGGLAKCCFRCLKACSASGVQWKSLFLMHFFKVKEFFVNLVMNLFRLASFPLRLWTSLIVRGDGSCKTASVLSRHGFIPFGFIMYHRNISSAAPNVYI